MELEKAIEILELNLKEAGSKMPPDTHQALTLGVSALNHVIQERIYDPSLRDEPLDGEYSDLDEP